MSSVISTLLFNNKEFDKAITSYTKAIELKNDYYLAYNNRGLAKYEKGLSGNDPMVFVVEPFLTKLEVL